MEASWGICTFVTASAGSQQPLGCGQGWQHQTTRFWAQKIGSRSEPLPVLPCCWEQLLLLCGETLTQPAANELTQYPPHGSCCFSHCRLPLEIIIMGFQGGQALAATRGHKRRQLYFTPLVLAMLPPLPPSSLPLPHTSMMSFTQTLPVTPAMHQLFRYFVSETSTHRGWDAQFWVCQ